MLREKVYMLSILTDFLHRRKTAIYDDLEWNTILAMAQSHQVEAILYHQCKNSLSNAISSRLSQLYASSLFYYSNRVKLLDSISAAFNNANLPFFTVKGLDVAALYPIPALRTMGDCDILVHPLDKTRAHEIMLSLGFQLHQQEDMEWIYYKNGLEFEIHDRLLYDEAVNSQVSKDFTELAWDYTSGDGCRKQLDWNFHLVFLLLHLKKHLLNSGAGLRQFMDLAVVVQKCNLDWSWLEETLEKLELLDFTKVCFTLCEKWFVVQMPLRAELTEAFYESATEKIFANGVFGFEDESNKENHNLNQIRKAGKIKTIIGRIFPPYKSVYYVPHYAFVQGKPWLLPVVWVYRLFRSLIYGKGADGVKLISSAVTVDGKLAEREAVLQQWGL